MSDDYNYFGEFTDDVEKTLQLIKDKIDEAIDWVCDRWDDLMDNWSTRLKMTSVVFAYQVHQAAKALEAGFQKLWDLFSDLATDLWAKVDEMAGGPYELMNMSHYYTWASAHLRDERILVDRMRIRLSDHWEGEAKDAFDTTMGEQENAIDGVSAGLTRAAAACAGGAFQLRSIWRDVIQTLLDVVGGILECVKDGTDAGQWISLDTGPAVKFYGGIGVSLLQLANDLEGYFDENATVQTAMWADLNTGLTGLLAGNTWPNVDPAKASDMDSKGDYVPR